MSVMQQGFYAPGDGGAATYNWNATSVCPPDVSGTAQPADGIVCVLPAGQSSVAAGRYILDMPKGILNAAQVGFSADGRDNAPANFVLSSIMSRYMGTAVNFPANPLYGQSNYYFSQPLEIVNTGSVSCGDGERAFLYPSVNLVFGPGVSGVRFEGYPTNFYFASTYAGVGSYVSSLSGCGIFSLGFGGFETGIGTTAGNPVIANVAFPSSDQINRGVKNAAPLVSVGDGLAVFHTIDYWNFSGSVTGDILTVTSWGGASFGSPDPGIAPGQLFHDDLYPGTNVPVGLWISQTHAEDATLTGTGHTGTYRLSSSIATPPAGAAQAKPGTITGNFQAEIQSGGPVVAVGTTVTGCSTLSGTHCGAGGTLTLSSAPALSLAYGVWLLPGPNTSNPYGSQMYNVTTSKVGKVYGPFTASISDGAGGSGNIYTVTAGGANIAPGQSVMINSIVTTTTTAPLTIGESASIPVASCAGISPGALIAGTSGGNQVFPAGTTVAGCSGTSLSVNLDQGPVGAGTTSGSNIVYLNQNQVFGYQLWIGEPITGVGIPANTTVTSTAKVTASGVPNVTISNNASATGSPAVSFGGAMFAAPSGASLTFTGGPATIVDYGTGTGGNGTYTINFSTFVAPGTSYTFDTPWTMYVRGGPRPIHQQDLLWSDAFPFGSAADQIYGKTAANQTVIVGTTTTYGSVSAMATHAAGSGSAWVLPSGIGMGGVQHNTYGNQVAGFPVGLNMACGGLNFPVVGCGRSYDSNNFFQYSLVGRLAAGNNSGGSMSIANEYDYNYVADIAEFATVGTTYIGEMLQGEDESTNTHDLIMQCDNNGSTFTGIYASGAAWAGTCLPRQHGMLGIQPAYVWQVPWFGQIYGAQADSLLVSGSPQIQIPSVDCPAGTPSSSFTVVGGRVTHC